MGARIICVVIGYLFGLFQTGYFYGKAHGIDIRQHGSGNAGTTNALRTLGKKAGAITLLGDAFKCVVAVLVTWLLFHNSQADIMPLLNLYTGAGVVLGHNYPFYLKFKGGKGIAATGGLIVAFNLPMAGIGLVTFALGYGITKYVSVGSLLVVTGFLIELVVFGQMGWFGMSGAHRIELYIVGAFLTLLAVWRHRENIKRLIHGTENKTYLSKKN
ncbi:glycerol-3-phosphate 1-O-acyltransferase PlsY [Lachnospiraceae bacterium ASD3451]|uniref:glycerol-3-phosphate 1-O-acyltransferase PlsY n=1 Tax=Diplocloster agilis TaxID=2850323 RepID=UPI001DE4F3C0|nr:glycerol-3-phosphate 1-O-acyltransferase PlsY [Diplocloster agilis]MBU9743346.1 glycerol-3-phosphate 1-O-acyltransferase PlsY [Diplocloster agilis]